MAIIGIGTDIVEIDRIERAANDSFLKRWFSDAENEFFLSRGMKTQTVAANFAAKEAFVKALGTGFEGVDARDIETLRSEKGKPFINVLGTAKDAADRLEVAKVHVSLTHEKKYALAFVVLEGNVENL